MDFNTFLFRLGLNPDNFVNKLVEPIRFDKGFIFELEQKDSYRQCPFCNSKNVYIKEYKTITITNKENINEVDLIKIKKIRYKCNECNKTFTKRLDGLDAYSSISNKTKSLIISELFEPVSFSQIARKYETSLNTIINIFDSTFKYVPRGTMPEVMCIDEIHFNDGIDNKYVTVITDFNQRKIIDIIRSRKMPYLREYFSNIPIKEREKTKVFISDMYEAYDTICRQYFPKAIHIIDLFHVITQLTNAINKIRIQVMNTEAHKGTPEYNFMKQHWQYFLCRRNRIPNKYHTVKATGVMIHYTDLVFRCIQLRFDLWEGYECLQELFKYSEYYTYEESLNFITRIIEKLEKTHNELLISVARTYHKWRYEIANGFDKKSRQIKYTNALAEGLNNQLKTIIKNAYGYNNFERFRKRALLIMSHKKDI